MVVKKFFFFILLLITFAFPLNLSVGQSLLEEEEPPENYQFQVFMEEEEALAKVFAGCDSIESEFLVLTPKGREYIQGLLKRRDLETAFQVYFGKKGNVIDRYAIITEEMGCFHPITWILSTDTQGKILDVAVMIYRETRGHEVSRRRFLTMQGSYKQMFTTAKIIEGVKAVVAAEVESEKQFFSLAHKAFQEIERIERLFKRELKALNKKAGKTLFPVIKRFWESLNAVMNTPSLLKAPLI
ncbi:conserved hypothetical protein [Candidatus Jettenia caeni]|uniref:Uncharacterized protein n=2 Tax=Candidatus Jettenia TaxID=360731 RepID=I3IR80_9BACT|nr:MAG: hypothetical protein EDM77_16295 [Candidatus Jettenia sp. AMX1]MCE7882184.1 hypothetical protein [Candidatus Jettenia sp. AMX1]MCQ3928747.1 hypothetical protein [Candidatus Jettenia sp.]GAB64225.1 conserved hypothetical protein [Candidatus Jettenia caeni]GJQ45218.1 MAG: hypothetical protein JETCAE04_09720 [Candidatus Jettenia caeni]